VGQSLAGYIAAALLARRRRRVRVLAPAAPLDAVPAPPIFALNAPIVQRVLDQLGLVHTVRTRLDGPPRPITLALPDRRFTLEPTFEARGRVLADAFPYARAELVRLFDRVEGYGRSLDTVLSGDIELPPEGFAARRLLRRQVMNLPVGLLVGVAPPWSEVPVLRRLIGALLAVAGRHEDADGPIRAGGARAIWHLCHGVSQFRNGAADLTEIVADKLSTFGGIAESDRIAHSVHIKRRKVTAVFDQRHRQYTADVVIFADDDASVAAMLGTPAPVAPPARVRIAMVPERMRPPELLDPCGWIATDGATPTRVRVTDDGLRMAWMSGNAEANLDRLTPFADVGTDLTESCALPTLGEEHDLLGLFRRPIRGPLKNVLRVGPWALPGLGLESDCLSAWIAAETAEKMLPRQRKLSLR
jgi:hypothetical protein